MRLGRSVGYLTTALLAAPAQGAVLEEFTVADWSGLALSDDQSGRLASCAVYSRYQNGATLFFIRHVDGNWTLSLVHESWELAEDSQYPLQYRVDREAPQSAAGVALDTDQIAVALTSGDPLLDQVRRGSLLTAVLHGKEYGFELSNSAKALAAAGECLERHRNTTGPQIIENPAPSLPPLPNPTAGRRDPPKDASPTGERQTFGAWVVSATQDAEGNFVNCTAFGVHGEDQLLLSYRPEGKWEFGLYRAAWALDPNQTYYLWYNVDAPADGEGVIKRPVDALEPTRIFFEVSVEEDIIERMEVGGELNLQLRGVAMEPESLSYALDRAGEAFPATRECTRHNIVAAESAEAGEREDDSAVAEPEAEILASALAAIGAPRIEQYAVPGWTVAAFADESGAFSHCGIEAGYENGTDLGFMRPAGGPLLVTLRRVDWNLPAGAWTPLRYRFEGAPAVATEAWAVDRFLAVLDLGSSASTETEWRNAGKVTVEVGGKRRSFDIADLGPGLDAMQACAERHRRMLGETFSGEAGSSNKAGSSGAGVETPEPRLVSEPGLAPEMN